ncbi:hypothetical protein, partial [Caulobacter endophyticus]|uniref:hypothetical protein n=1 Tax=Caulobacter endophyticus TaxID=2172652 RepID=UPI00240F4159
WSSPVARQAHNLKVTGSNPVPAPKLPQAFFKVDTVRIGLFSCRDLPLIVVFWRQGGLRARIFLACGRFPSIFSVQRP